MKVNVSPITPMNQQRIRRRIYIWTVIFIVALVLSGITAFPLDYEITWLNANKELFPEMFHEWISKVYEGIHNTSENYPFMAYGTDWLAFAHIAIGLAFIGPLRDPVKNKWVIEWAILCCIFIIPVTIVAGHVRGIPFYHQIIDCSFGIFGLIPLLIVHKYIIQLEMSNKHFT